jgi:hypothetical protein
LIWTPAKIEGTVTAVSSKRFFFVKDGTVPKSCHILRYDGTVAGH